MSVESFAIALNHSKAAGTAKLVLLGIANHDGDGGAWPSVRTLARYAGIRDRTAIQKAISRLEDLGEIRRDIQAGGDERTAPHMRPNRYQFLLRCPQNCDRSSSHKLLDEDDLDPAANERPRRYIAAPPAANERPEPSFNQLTTLKEKITSPKRASAREEDSDSSEFNEVQLAAIRRGSITAEELREAFLLTAQYEARWA